MTAITSTYLLCDYLRCPQKYEPPAGEGWPPAATVRREARREGWTHVRSSLGRRFDKDYCPDHPEGSAPSAGTGQEHSDG